MHPIRGQISEVISTVIQGWSSCYGLSQRIMIFKCTLSTVLFNPQHKTYLSSAELITSKLSGVEKINPTLGKASTKSMDKHSKKWSENLSDVRLAYLYSSAQYASILILPKKFVYKEPPLPKFEMLTEKISPTIMRVKINRIQHEAAEKLRQAVESDLEMV